MRRFLNRTGWLALAGVAVVYGHAAAAAPGYSKQKTWLETMLAR